MMYNLFTGMKNGTQQDLINRYNEMLQDVKENAKELLLRCEYFTHKYRGTRLEDVNLGVWEEAYGNYTAQIFVRTRHNKYIKHIISFDYKGRIIKEEKISNAI